ncbi:MAG: hypothetical protein FWG65_01645 [Turicibacter sp.]|nr:hypothetical protein [Turicibacter sp.]
MDNSRLLEVAKKSKISSTNDLARVVAPKLTQFLYNILRVGPRVILRSAFELLRANTITRVLSAIVLILIDTISLIKGRISFKQYVINLVLAFMLMIGGTVGWVLGGHIVSLVILENVVIGIVAGLIGAGALGAFFALAWDRFVKKFIRDDTRCMLDICNAVFAELIDRHELTEQEIALAKERINITSAFLVDMYAQRTQECREEFALELIEPTVLEIKNQDLGALPQPPQGG